VWGFTGAALDEGDEAADWCTRAIAAAGEGGDGGGASTKTPRRVRLVRHAPELNLRTVDPNFALPGTTVGFADEFPILAATEGSLADLNARLKEKDPQAPDLQMARFRPNLVFIGGEATDSPWADDGWARVRVSGRGGGEGGGDQASSSSSSSCDLAYVKPCSRCKVTTVNPESGALTAGEQPLPALRAFRSGAALGWDARRPAFKHAVFFAWNVQPVVAAKGGGGYEAYTSEEGPLCVLERGSRAEVVARRAWE
jgi:uncharacterized protein YcbX